MTTDTLLGILQNYRYAVMATVNPKGDPQAALVGFAITDQFELIFDTLDRTRKCLNLRAFPKIAGVIGWEGEVSIQYEGVSDEPRGAELDRLKEIYFRTFPEGRERQQVEGIIYFRVKPSWIRYSNFNDPLLIIEFQQKELKR